MRVLAVDTTTELGSVALRVDGALVGEMAARVRARHGEVLLPRIAAVLEAGALALADLDLLVVTVGPGSFTGVRVGVSTVKGLALGAGKPVVGVGSLEALAKGATGSSPSSLVGAILDAHKGEVFVAAYRNDGGPIPVEVLGPRNASPAAAAAVLADLVASTASRDLVLLGDGLVAHGEAFATAVAARQLPSAVGAPRALWAAVIGEARFQAGGPDDLQTLEPRYVRGADARLPDRPLDVR